MERLYNDEYEDFDEDFDEDDNFTEPDYEEIREREFDKFEDSIW